MSDEVRQESGKSDGSLLDKVFGKNKGFLFYLVAFSVVGLIFYLAYNFFKSASSAFSSVEFLIIVGFTVLIFVVYKGFQQRKVRSVDAFELVERARERILREWGVFDVPPNDASVSVEPISNGALIFFATKGVQVKYNSLFDTFDGVKFTKWSSHRDDVVNDALPAEFKAVQAQESLRRQAQELQR